jgi:iron transport multicopper oxidase
MLFFNSQSFSLYVLFLCATVISGETVTYDFNITWVNANPDGAFDRPTIGINGIWPIPTIRATVGDRVIVNIQNQLGNQSTSLHFHGLFMNGTTEMDGPVGVTQCPVAPGGSFTYNFTVCCDLIRLPLSSSPPA